MEVIEVDPNALQFCRCCYQSFLDVEMENIFDCLYEQIELHEIISLLAPVSISADDEYSHLICSNCMGKAIDAYSFRKTCIDSDTLFHNSIEESDEQISDDIDNQSLLEHELRDDEETIDGSSFSCHCQALFDSLSDYNEHLKSHQKEEKMVNDDKSRICVICQKFCVSQSILELHMSSHLHTEQPYRSYGEKRKHQCHICAKRFQVPSKLNRHMIVHRDVLDPSEVPERPPKDYKYECFFCSKRLETPSKLTRHLRVHDKNNSKFVGINQHRPLPCSECDLRFWDNTKLERHKVIHSEDFERSRIQHPADQYFTCAICLDRISDYDDCIQHMKDHREEIGENTEVKCKLCPKSYPKLSNLIRHARTHEENATHECIHCGKRMGMGDDLIDHLLCHQGFKPFHCEVEGCEKSFIKYHKLRLHQKSHEDNIEKPHACNQCEKTFSDVEYLKRHLLRHSGRKDHACSLCPSRFTFKSGLNSHMTTHSMNSKKFSCDKCDAKFTKMQSLRTHQKIHLDDKKYVCEICSMRFITSGQMRRHQRIHSGEKPYICSHCNKAYSQSNDLMKHLRTHLGPNVYKCDIGDCLEAFTTFSKLRNHKQIHYNNVMLIEEEYGGEIELL